MTLGRVAQAPLPALPDGSPPWLIALGTLAALAALTAPYWGPALTRKVRGTTPEQPPSDQQKPPTDATTSSTAAPVASPTTVVEQPIGRADAAMVMLDRMVTDLQRGQDNAEMEAAGLRTALAEAARRETALEVQLATTRQQLTAATKEIERLRWERDQLLGPARFGLPPGGPTPGS